MARFNGKKVVIVPVVQAMKRPQELINEALSGSAPVYSHSEILLINLLVRLKKEDFINT